MRYGTLPSFLHRVFSVCLCLFEGQSALSVAVSASVASLSHWPQYADMLGILVLRFLSLSVSALTQYSMIIVGSLTVISSEVNHEFLLHCRAWEPRWLLPGETIVADEAVTKSLKTECPVILVQLL